MYVSRHILEACLAVRLGCSGAVARLPLSLVDFALQLAQI